MTLLTRHAEPAEGPQPGVEETTLRTRMRAWLPYLLVLLGVLVLAYPVGATYLNNRGQAEVSQFYSDEMDEEFTEEEIAEMIADARAYNENVDGGPILEPWLVRIREDNPSYMRYLSQLHLKDVMGRIIIPEIRSDLPIYHGTTEDVLGKGIGHLYGTSLPVGGARTHAVLTGHTGLTYATMWDNLRDLKEGDAVYIQVGKEKLKYEVDATEVVEPDHTKGLAPAPGKDQLTLITCTPYGINSHRLMVHTHRVPMDASDDVFSRPLSPWQWWMKVVLVVIVLVLMVLAYALYRVWKRRKAAADVAADEETVTVSAREGSGNDDELQI